MAEEVYLMYWTKDVEYGDVRQEKKGSEHKKSMNVVRDDIQRMV